MTCTTVVVTIRSGPAQPGRRHCPGSSSNSPAATSSARSTFPASAKNEAASTRSSGCNGSAASARSYHSAAKFARLPCRLQHRPPGWRSMPSGVPPRTDHGLSRSPRPNRWRSTPARFVRGTGGPRSRGRRLRWRRRALLRALVPAVPTGPRLSTRTGVIATRSTTRTRTADPSSGCHDTTDPRGSGSWGCRPPSSHASSSSCP